MGARCRNVPVQAHQNATVHTDHCSQRLTVLPSRVCAPAPAPRPITKAGQTPQLAVSSGVTGPGGRAAAQGAGGPDVLRGARASGRKLWRACGRARTAGKTGAHRAPRAQTGPQRGRPRRATQGTRRDQTPQFGRLGARENTECRGVRARGGAQWEAEMPQSRACARCGRREWQVSRAADDLLLMDGHGPAASQGTALGRAAVASAVAAVCCPDCTRVGEGPVAGDRSPAGEGSPVGDRRLAEGIGGSPGYPGAAVDSPGGSPAGSPVVGTGCSLEGTGCSPEDTGCSPVVDTDCSPAAVAAAVLASSVGLGAVDAGSGPVAVGGVHVAVDVGLDPVEMSRVAVVGTPEVVHVVGSAAGHPGALAAEVTACGGIPLAVAEAFACWGNLFQTAEALACWGNLSPSEVKPSVETLSPEVGVGVVPLLVSLSAVSPSSALGEWKDAVVAAPSQSPWAPPRSPWQMDCTWASWAVWPPAPEAATPHCRTVEQPFHCAQTRYSGHSLHCPPPSCAPPPSPRDRMGLRRCRR